MRNLQLIFTLLIGLFTCTTFAGTKKWTGDVNSDWENAANWDGGLPGGGDDIVIDSVNEYTGSKAHPVISSNSSFTAKGLTLNEGGKLYIQANLTVNDNFKVFHDFSTEYETKVVMTAGDVYIANNKNLELKFGGKFYQNGGNLYVSKELKLEEGGYFYLDEAPGPSTVTVNYDGDSQGKLKIKAKSGSPSEFNMYAGTVTINTGSSGKEIEIDEDGGGGSAYALLNIEGGTFTNHGDVQFKKSDGDSTVIAISGGDVTFEGDIADNGGNGTIDIQVTGGDVTFEGDITTEDGDNISNSGGSVTMAGTQDITSAGVFVSDDTTHITGDVTLSGTDGTWQFNHIRIASGATLTQSGPDIIYVEGHWINEGGTFAEGTKKVVFNGSGVQNLTAGAGETFYDLDINKPGGSLVLGASTDITISNNLDLASGKIYASTNGGTVIFPDGANYTGSSNSSYVIGKVQKTGSVAFTFPVGSVSGWARVAISAPSTSSTFEAEYFRTGYGQTINREETLEKVSNNEYWQLDRTAGSGSAAVTLYWEDAAFSEITGTVDLVVAHYNTTDSEWKNETQSGGVTLNTVTSQVLTSFSPFGFGEGGGGGGALPVKLLYFDAFEEGNIAILNWATATEINSDLFEIQRSRDAINYETIEIVDGAGNSSEQNDYTAYDEIPYEVTYYRLRQVDYDGQFEYFGPVAVNGRTRPVATEVAVYPNPVTGSGVTIEVPGCSTGYNEIRILDNSGKEMWAGYFECSESRRVETVDLSHITQSGYHILVHRNGVETSTHPLMIQR